MHKEQVHRYRRKLEWCSWILRDIWNNSDKANLEHWTFGTWLLCHGQKTEWYTPKSSQTLL